MTGNPRKEEARQETERSEEVYHSLISLHCGNPVAIEQIPLQIEMFKVYQDLISFACFGR